jgi:hypothetical protein
MDATLYSLEQAEAGLRYGAVDQNALQNPMFYKTHQRYGNDFAGFVLSDFQFLLSLLFAKKALRDAQYVADTKAAANYIPIPMTPIDIIESVWQDIMPHNRIEFKNGRIAVSIQDGDSYHGKEMSDGERVALYLLGQCLCAADNSILILDEPEVHLHKSLMSRLWNKIEELCPNKVLVYITHDLDFATSRKGAKKLWIKQFLGGDRWLWNEVPEIEEIPESLLIEIIGNRKHILFCEGEMGGYDHTIYQAAYPQYHVIPRGGCQKVIESTRAFNNNAAIQHIVARGIVDADYRTQEEIQELENDGIFVISVAEVENLFCVEPLLRLVAENQHMNIDETVNAAKEYITNALTQELETQITNDAEKEIRYKLSAFVKTDSSEAGLANGLATLLQSVDIHALYEISRQKFQTAIDREDYSAILRVYNRKRISERISPTFNLAHRDYVNILLRMLNTGRKSEIVAAILPYLPDLPQG